MFLRRWTARFAIRHNHTRHYAWDYSSAYLQNKLRVYKFGRLTNYFQEPGWRSLPSRPTSIPCQFSRSRIMIGMTFRYYLIDWNERHDDELWWNAISRSCGGSWRCNFKFWFRCLEALSTFSFCKIAFLGLARLILEYRICNGRQFYLTEDARDSEKRTWEFVEVKIFGITSKENTSTSLMAFLGLAVDEDR